MIHFDKESPVICDKCGKPAVRRELPVGNRFVSFDTHDAHIARRTFFAALERMEKFYTRAYAVLDKLKALPEEKRKLSMGEIREFDFEPIRPSACEPRVELRVVASVRAFGLREDVRSEPILVKGIRVDKILKAIRPLCEEATARLKRRYEEGRF